MKYKLIFVLLLSIFIILPLVSSLDPQLPQQCCGGDSELCIACLGDEELIALGAVPAIVGPPEGGGVPIEEEEVIPPEELPPTILSIIATFLGIKEEDVLFFGAIILLIFILVLLIFARRKKRCKAVVEGKRCKNKAEKEGYCMIHYKIFKEEKYKR